MLLTRHEVLTGPMGHARGWSRYGDTLSFKRVLLLSCVVGLVWGGDSYAAASHHHHVHSHKGHHHRAATASAPHSQDGPTSSGGQEGQASSDGGDVLLKGVPAGWRAHVIGAGTSQKKADDHPASKSAAGVKDGHSKAALSPVFTKEEVQNGVKPGDALEHSSTARKVPSYPASVNRVLIPIPTEMGIAAYQSGRNFVLIIDGEEPLDTSSLRGDGIFSNLSVQTLPKTTMITVPLPDTRRLFLSQQSNGWVLGDVPPPGGGYDTRQVITPQETPAGLLFPMKRPGRVLSLKDPTSGESLVVGTAAFDNGGILSLRKGDGYDVWPSLEGVVIADHAPPKVELKRTPVGDLMTISGGKPPDLDQAVYASDVDLTWLGLKHLSYQQANARYRKALIDAADAEPKDRFAKRLEAAKAAFNIGSFPEARSIANVALEDDPEEAFRPDVRFFLGATELLNGNPQGAQLLDDEWPESQQRAIQVWKGLYYAAKGGHDQEAAHYLATDFPRLLNYPETLRDVVLPLATEHIARYGTQEDMRALDAMPKGAPYRLARAFRDIRSGRSKIGEELLKGLESDRDATIAEKAMEERIALQLREGRLSSMEAARQFSSLLPDARLSGRDGWVRILQADAYMRVKRWNDALTAMDQAKKAPMREEPELAPMLHQALKGVAQESQQGASPKTGGALLHGAAMVRAHLPDLPPGPEKADVLVFYGKMLNSLGLYDEASQAFSSAVPMFEDPTQKAMAGEALADSYLKRGMLPDASRALAETGNAALPKNEVAKRNRLVARIALSSGKPEVAFYLLNGDNSAAASDMKAKIYEGQENWAAAIIEVRKMAESLIPDQGPLSMDQQLLALRLASDASRAGDAETLRWVVHKVGDRSFDGDTGRMFKLLVSP